MSRSLAGSAATGPSLRTKRSCAGPFESPGNTGSQRDAGAISGAGAYFRVPVRRSYSGAMVLRQLAAAISRCAGVSSNWTSFSASTKVAVVTCGPAPGAVPKAGGAPGGRSCGAALAMAAAAVSDALARLRNFRRELDIVEGIVTGYEPAPQ